jgi:hypothetical protein
LNGKNENKKHFSERGSLGMAHFSSPLGADGASFSQADVLPPTLLKGKPLQNVPAHTIAREQLLKN